MRYGEVVQPWRKITLPNLGVRMAAYSNIKGNSGVLIKGISESGSSFHAGHLPPNLLLFLLRARVFSFQMFARFHSCTVLVPGAVTF